MVDNAEGQGTDFEQGEGEAIDMSGVAESGGFEVLPKGVYPFVVSSAEYKLSQAGNRMFSLQLEVEDGDYAGRKLFTNITFSQKALGMAKLTLKALGASYYDATDFVPSQETANELVGLRGRAQVAIEKYEGEDTNRVKNIKPALDGENVLGEGE